MPASRIRTTCSNTLVAVVFGSRPMRRLVEQHHLGAAPSASGRTRPASAGRPRARRRGRSTARPTTGKSVLTKSVRSAIERLVAHRVGAEADVLGDGHLLEDASGPGGRGPARRSMLLRPVAGDVDTVDRDACPSAGVEHAAGDLEHRGLAGAVRADQADDADRRDRDGEPAQHQRRTAVAGLDVAQVRGEVSDAKVGLQDSWVVLHLRRRARRRSAGRGRRRRRGRRGSSPAPCCARR